METCAIILGIKNTINYLIMEQIVETKYRPESDSEFIGAKLNTNLTILMNRNNVSLSQLHRNTGVTIPTIKRMQSDPSSNPTISTLIPIAKFFDVTIEQLVGSSPLPIEINGYVENKTHWFKVPLILWEEISLFINESLSDSKQLYVSVDIDVGAKPFALKVIDDDWVSLPKDSILVINRDIKPEHKDFALIEKIGHGLPTIKQVIIDQDKIYLKPMNPHLALSLFDETYVFHGVLAQIRKDIKI